MATDKKSMQEQQAKQFSQLLKDYGLVGDASQLSSKERKQIDGIFPDNSDK